MFADRSIIIYELPTFTPHGAAAGGLYGQLFVHLNGNCIGGMDSLMTSIPSGWSKQPDGWFTPRGKPSPGPTNHLKSNEHGAPWPNVVIEVRAYTGKM